MTASRPTNPQANATSVSSLPATPGRLTLLARQSDYYWTRLRRTWKGSIVTAVVTPLMYVLAMGVVLGGVIDEAGTGPAGAPSYLHFIAAAPGYRPVTTHVFVADSPYLDSDAVFGVKESLIREVPEVDDPARAAEVGLANPFRTLTFDLTLLRADQAPPVAQPAQAQPTVVRGAPS